MARKTKQLKLRCPA